MRTMSACHLPLCLRNSNRMARRTKCIVFSSESFPCKFTSRDEDQFKGSRNTAFHQSTSPRSTTPSLDFRVSKPPSIPAAPRKPCGRTSLLFSLLEAIEQKSPADVMRVVQIGDVDVNFPIRLDAFARHRETTAWGTFAGLPVDRPVYLVFLAAVWSSAAVLESLFKLGANPQSCDENARTSLHHLCLKKGTEDAAASRPIGGVMMTPKVSRTLPTGKNDEQNELKDETDGHPTRTSIFGTPLPLSIPKRSKRRRKCLQEESPPDNPGKCVLSCREAVSLTPASALLNCGLEDLHPLTPPRKRMSSLWRDSTYTSGADLGENEDERAIKVLNCLLKYKTNVYARDHYHKSALDYALSNRKHRIAEILIGEMSSSA